MDDVQLDQNMTLEDMWQGLHILQLENNKVRRAFEQLQAGASLAPQNLGSAINQTNQ